GLLLPALLVVRSLMGVFTAPVYPSSSRLVSHWLPSSQRTAVNGVVQGAAIVGIASTFFLFGGLMDWFGWPTAFVISGVVTAALALTWMIYGADDPTQHAGVNAAERSWIGAEEKTTREGAADHVSAWTLLRNRSLMLLTISYAAVGYFE